MVNTDSETIVGFDTPVAMFNFNRPYLTRQVFEVVRQIKPRKLLLVADGPRADRPKDARLCAEVRAIFEEIDWECEVLKNFSDTNMGSFKRNSSGLNWVFDTVKEAIILEDDCVPSLSFFPYCTELLERYRNDHRIGMICGSNFSVAAKESENKSYYFSAYGFGWGWASWRRVWEEVDLDMAWWNQEIGKKLIEDVFLEKIDRDYWYSLFSDIKLGKRRNAWDYQLLLSCFRNKQLNVIPMKNQIANIGFGEDAVHFNSGPTQLHNIPVDNLHFPMDHPEVQVASSADREFSALFVKSSPSWRQRMINKTKLCASNIFNLTF